MARTTAHTAMAAELWRRLRSIRRNARLYLLSNTLQAVTAGAIVVIYSLFLVALGYSTSAIGLVLVVGSLGAGLAIVPAAPLVRRLGWRNTLIWSNLIGGVSVAIQLFIPTLPVILITSLGVGASVAMYLIVNAPFLAANSTTEERTALFGLSNALNYLAAVVGSLLGGILPQLFASPTVLHSPLITRISPLLVSGQQARVYQLSLLAVGAIALPSIIPIFFIHDEPRQAQVTLPAAAIPATALTWTRARERMRRVAHDAKIFFSGVVGRFSLPHAIIGFGAGLFVPYFSLYFVDYLHTSTVYFGVLSAVQTVLLAIGALLAAPLASRFGKLVVALVAQSASLPFLLALGLFQVVPVASVAYLFRGFLMNVSDPALQTYLMEAVPEDGRVQASEVYNLGFQVTGSAGSGLGGWLLAVGGTHLPFLIAFALYAIAIALLAVWFLGGRDTPAKPAPLGDATVGADGRQCVP